MNVIFEIAALFPLPFSRVKKCGNFKINIHLDSVESFLYYLSSKMGIGHEITPVYGPHIPL